MNSHITALKMECLSYPTHLYRHSTFYDGVYLYDMPKIREEEVLGSSKQIESSDKNKKTLPITIDTTVDSIVGEAPEGLDSGFI